MKILMVIAYFAPKWGGDVNVCVNFSKFLVESGHDVTILTTDYGIDESFVEKIQKYGVKVTILPSPIHLGLFIFSPTLNTWLKKNIKNFDIIHLHHSRSFQNILVCYHARRNSVPYIIQSHGNTMAYHSQIFLKKSYDFLWGTKDLRGATNVIALTESEVKQYEFRGVSQNKITIIPNGIDLTEFKNLPNKGEFRKKCQIPDDCKIILYLGRLHETKGLDLLIDAFYELNKKTNECRLVIAGPDNGYLSNLLTKIRNLHLEREIFVIGFISNEEKIQAMIDSDVFVTPSFSGFPVTFLESCACGLPIITSTHGDTLSWIDDNVGIVVEYDIHSLKTAINRILNDNDLKTKFGENGKDLVKTKFNWAKIIQSLETMYLWCIKGERESP